MKKEVKDKDAVGPLSGREPDPPSENKEKSIIKSPAEAKKAETKMMTIRISPGAKLPWIIACHQRDPHFIMKEYRALQAGQPVKVIRPLGEYLLQWCEEIKIEDKGGQ